jgi:signal transduction histidine kinase
MVHDQAAAGLRINLELDALPADIPALVVEALSVAIREAVNNAAQHADVQEVWLTAAGDGRGGMTIAVIDRGIGFDMDATPAGLGLTRSIRERTIEVGGTVKIDSTPGQGTIVEMSWTPVSTAREF